MRTLVAASALGLVMGAVSPAYAQGDFGALRLKPGDVVYVSPPSGPEIRGRVTFVSPAAIAVEGVEVKPEPGLRIQRRGDPLWDGALYGAVVGALLGVVVGTQCEVRGSFAKCVASGAAWLGGLGLLVDIWRVGRTTIYVGTSPSPAPAIGATTAADARSGGPITAVGLRVSVPRLIFGRRRGDEAIGYGSRSGG